MQDQDLKNKIHEGFWDEYRAAIWQGKNMARLRAVSIRGGLGSLAVSDVAVLAAIIIAGPTAPAAGMVMMAGMGLFAAAAATLGLLETVVSIKTAQKLEEDISSGALLQRYRDEVIPAEIALIEARQGDVKKAFTSVSASVKQRSCASHTLHRMHLPKLGR